MELDGTPRFRRHEWILIIVGIAALIWAAYAIPVWLNSLTSPYGAGVWTQKARDESHRRGDLILSEITRFQQTHGRWPTSLDEIETGSFRAPRPTAGTERWRYHIYTDGHFVLAFECEGGYPCMYYSSKHAEWRLDM